MTGNDLAGQVAELTDRVADLERILFVRLAEEREERERLRGDLRKLARGVRISCDALADVAEELGRLGGAS